MILMRQLVLDFFEVLITKNVGKYVRFSSQPLDVNARVISGQMAMDS